MKTILQILVILLVAAIVAGGVYALVENTTLVSSADAGHGQPPAMLNADGTSAQLMERGEGGGEHGASFTRGMSGLLVTLAKSGVITVFIVLLRKGFDLLQSVKPKAIQS